MSSAQGECLALRGRARQEKEATEEQERAHPPAQRKQLKNQVELRGHKFPEWSVTPSDRGFSIRGERTGGGGHKPSLPPVLTGATRRQRRTDQRERLRSSRPSGATDTVYRVRGPGGWDGQVGLQALQTHCAPKKPVTASELTSQEV